MRYKSQSSIEFLSVYGFAFLIIALVIAVVFSLSSLPKSVIPAQCTVYGSFTCVDAIYTGTGSSHSTLMAEIYDGQTGILNVSTFNAVLNSRSSVNGVCVPHKVMAGQTMYCIANFSSAAVTGLSYSGTMQLTGNYCPQAPGGIGSGSCNWNGQSQYALSGSVNVQGANVSTSLSVNKAYYVPITITNTQAAATPSPFQQMISFNPSTYSSYERSNLGNIRFYLNGTELHSWCESGCTSASSNAVFWVSLPVPIAASSNAIINMYLLPTIVQYDGVYAGEAPQLSQTYAEYDDGASVFNNYWNFAGTSLSSSFIQEICSGATISQNNMITLTTPSSCGFDGVIINTPIGSPQILEGDVTSWGGGAGGLAEQASNACDTEMYIYNGWSGGYEGYSPSTSQGICAGFTSLSTSFVLSAGIDGLAWLSSSSEIWYHNYNSYSTTSSAAGSLPSSIYPSIGIYEYSSSTSITFQWLRTRAYPPNGVMPSVAFGSVASANAMAP